MRLSGIENNFVYLQSTDSSVNCISSLIEYIVEPLVGTELAVNKIQCDKIYFSP